MGKTKQVLPSISSNPRIAVTSPTFGKLITLRKELKEVFPNSYFNENSSRLSEPELGNFLKDADAAIVGIEPITDIVLGKATRLKIISKYGVGLDNIDKNSSVFLKERLTKNVLYFMSSVSPSLSRFGSI